jgi:hypothetical protein
MLIELRGFDGRRKIRPMSTSMPMIDWIEWTRCAACDYMEKEVVQKPDDAPPTNGRPGLLCPKCGKPARLITFPAFEVETIDISMSIDPLRDEMEDW